jgi:phage terminase large subunit-like protein
MMRALYDTGVFDAPPEVDDAEMIYHEPTGRLRVVATRVWRPTAGRRVSVEAVENEILQLDKAFGLAAVSYDPWQAEYLAERLTKLKVTTDAVTFVAQNLQSMAQTTMETFGNRLIDLPNNADLLTDLRALRIVEKSYGIRLDSPRGAHGHGDVATALAIALHSIKRFSAVRRKPRLDRPLVCHPSMN